MELITQNVHSVFGPSFESYIIIKYLSNNEANAFIRHIQGSLPASI